MAGRPSEYRPELGQEIADRLADGESLNSICKLRRMPHERTVRRWVLWDVDPDFTAAYKEAREIQAHGWFDQIVTISDEAVGQDLAGVTACRVRMDARRWCAARILPNAYGDKLEHHHSGGVVVMIPPNDRQIEDAGARVIDGTAQELLEAAASDAQSDAEPEKDR